jgi:hypothetical protein
VSGTARHRQQLSATPGSWRGSPPIAYAYQWQRCKSAATSCIEIPDATHATYIVRLADAGSALRVAVTASNAAGSATAASALTTPVPYQCIVPSLKRKTVRAARRKLTASHCRLGSVKRRYSRRVAVGRIISQRPGGGTELADRGKVSVVVSRGRHH